MFAESKDVQLSNHYITTKGECAVNDHFVSLLPELLATESP